MKPVYKRVSLAKGVNLLADESSIDDAEVTYAKNLIPLAPGRIGKRGGMALRNLLMANTRIPISFHRPTFNGPFDGVVCTRRSYVTPENTTLWAVAYNGGVGSIALSYDFGAVTDKRVAVSSFRSKMYGFAGYGATTQGAIVQANPASANGFEIVAFAFQGTGNGSVYPMVAVPYRNRMVFFNLGPGYESTGVMSEDFDPTLIGDSPADTRALIVGDRDGDRVVGAIEVMLSGIDSRLQSGLLVLREFSAYLVTGELEQPSNTSDPYYGDVAVQKINTLAGCSSPDTIVQTPYGVIWAGPDDVWLFNVGTLPVRIGWKIRPVLAATPASYRYLWHAAYHDGFYRLALLSPDQDMTRPHDMPCGEQWWLDLREGAPANAASAKWFGPQIYNSCKAADTTPTPGTRFMTMDLRPGVEQELLGVELSVADTTANGGLATVNMVAYDSANAFDSAMNLTSTEPVEVGRTSLADAVDNEVSTEIHTKEYDLGDPNVDKLVQGVELDLYLSQPARMQVVAVLDGGRSVKTFNEDIDNTGFLGGVDPLDSATHLLSTEYQAVQANPSPTERNIGKRIQFRISDLPGFVVGPNNSGIQLNLTNSGIQAVTLTEGYYTNLLTLCDMIIAKLSAATGGVFTHTVTAPPRPNLVSIGANILWDFRFVNLALADNAAARATRIIGTWLGYDTTAAGGLGVTRAADTAVPFKLSAAMGIGDILLNMKPSRRRPI